ncbi:alpha/beta hydrolase [Pedobacter sp. SYSU D00535]|uniref:alpha/beta hydrolase n=1 Tax=Pedobacter sp. SYSU D00535 TaxID=2810308 RepID=UPI001A9772FC|nr:dienelactone hydrolase family protein [Pedobacter sp. SYSU D00535]
MYTHEKNILTEGLPLEEAQKVVIMIHGRGATAESIASLADHLQLADAAILAPQATNNSWYPYSFMAPVQQNQPALDSALDLIGSLLAEVEGKGIPSEHIYFLGFSQGACLSLEFVARNGKRYGGVIAYTGGLIGEKLDRSNYKGDFAGTPVLLTTGDPDPHVPVGRVEESVSILEELKARVTLKIYKGRPHTIQMEEIQLANQLILS